ncbi:MAG: DNA polymerase [Spirochaetales bacterium]|nr:DNA polymerase [Spirochaetales bacterium]
MRSLSIDIETKSGVDLARCGVYRYSEDPLFDILLFGVSVDGGPVEVYDLACGEKLPEDILKALVDGSVTKWAFNASFERVCISAWLRRNHPSLLYGYGYDGESLPYLDPASWRCTMVWSAYLGLPLSLANVGKILKLENQKLKEGADLIRYFCSPCRPTKTNDGRTWNLPEHSPGKWELFKRYNLRDVEVEMQIQQRLCNHPVPESVWDEYHLDQMINDRGIGLDMDLVHSAIKLDGISSAEVSERMRQLTDLDNPNSVVQMKAWLKENGLKTDTLGKKTVQALIKESGGKIRETLELRLQMAKSSVKKYQAMEDTVCSDSRAHGMFQFYGANRSGRWAGRHIQLQNLPQNHIPDLENARAILKTGDYELMKIMFDDVPDTLSQLIRTAFVPKKGCKFIVSDFSSIEARVLAFLADEKWRIDVFKNNGDIYCASASAMFKVPVEKHGRNAELRQKGKIAELALGYGGSVGALKSMGAIELGLKEDELQPLVTSWRNANPGIVGYWWKIDSAVRKAISECIPTSVGIISFECRKGMLFITLPSGRRLSYVRPRITVSDDGRQVITYEGVGLNKHWERIESYGPKFVENIIQAISRDILAHAMKRLWNMRIVAHVHDELIIECPIDTRVDEICGAMGKTPEWIEGLYLRADGYETMFYMKD